MIRGVYGIAGQSDVGASLLSGGVRILQLRVKDRSDREIVALAHEIRRQTREVGAVFVMNDRADIAAIVGADAVHLGQDDPPARAVRGWLPPEIKIGVSCHDLTQIEDASQVADYVGFGPVFRTTTKIDPDPVVGLERLRDAVQRSPVPVVAIGGIDLSKLEDVQKTGVASAAMISGMQTVDQAKRAIAIWGVA